MKKICVVCGKPFAAKAEHGKYCSTVCKNRSRYPRSREQQKLQADADRSRAIDLYNSGKTLIEVGEMLGRSATWVRKALNDFGIETKRRLTEKQIIVKRLREKGLCCSEIIKQTGLNKKQVHLTVKAIGLQFTEEEKKKSIKLAFEKARQTRYHDKRPLEQKAKDYINTNCPGWTYISGFINDDGYMKLRCGECGEVVERASQTVRKNNNFACPVCKEREKEKLQKEREEQKRAAEEEKRRAFWSQDFEQTMIQFRECKNCGTIFIGKSKTECYCSDKCRRKVINHKHDHRIDRAPIIEKGITVEKVFKRDHGICWLCGRACRFEDKKIVNGHTVVGREYPSRDHVIPLKFGGDHTWENIRLAHHYCNTIKRDKVVC